MGMGWKPALIGNNELKPNSMRKHVLTLLTFYGCQQLSHN